MHNYSITNQCMQAIQPLSLQKSNYFADIWLGIYMSVHGYMVKGEVTKRK